MTCRTRGASELSRRSTHDSRLSTRTSVADDDEAILAALGGPDFTAAAVDLTNISVDQPHDEGLKALRRGIEADERIGTPIAQPDPILFVNVDGVRVRLAARQLPFAPLAGKRVVAPDLARVPLADPDDAARVGPHAPRT